MSPASIPPLRSIRRGISSFRRAAPRPARATRGSFNWGYGSISDAQFPAPAYAETVLSANFADSQKYFTDALLAIHRAHLAMLTEQGILAREHAATLLKAL